MIETTDPVSDYETAKNAAIDARLRLEDRLKSLELERQQIRQLLGRVRKPKAAASKPARKSRKPAITDGATA